MSFISLPHKIRANSERLLGNVLVWKDWLLAKDDLTKNITRVLAQPGTLPKETRPESGQRNYSSLSYANATAGARMFQQAVPFAYARIGHPTLAKLGLTLKQFDPAAEHVALTAHGMSAVEASFAALKKGDHLVASNFVFSSCRKEIEHLEKLGIEVSWVDGRDLAAWETNIRPNTKLFWFENPGNPTMELVDIAQVSRIAHAPGRDILVAVDNSLAFPAHRPLSDGADIVVASLTKTLGLGTDSGGVVLISEEGHKRLQRLTGHKKDPVLERVVLAGLTMSPRVADLFLEKGRIATLPARFKRQQETALKIARHIAENYPNVFVNHPLTPRHPQYALARKQMTGTGIFSLDLGSRQAAFQFIDALIKHGVKNVNNFGSPVTSTAHPASTTHFSITEEQRQAQGIGPGLVRLSIGTENAAYLIGVFDSALKGIEFPAPQSRRETNSLTLST